MYSISLLENDEGAKQARCVFLNSAAVKRFSISCGHEAAITPITVAESLSGTGNTMHRTIAGTHGR